MVRPAELAITASTDRTTQINVSAQARTVIASGELYPQLPALTGLRFFAALLVVLVHFGQHLAVPGLIHQLAVSGAQGVSLFFVLSGFILTYTYGRIGGMQQSKRQYYIARLARVYPVYIFGLLLGVGGALSTSTSDVTPVHLSPVIVAISTLTLTQAWLPWFHFVWNGPSWSLSAEAVFYLLFPFMCSDIGRLPLERLGRLLLLCAGVTQVVPLTYMVIEPDRGLSAAVPFWLDAALFNPLVHLPTFLFGMLLARLYVLRRSNTISQHHAGLALVAVGATIAALILSNQLPGMMVRDGLFVPVFGLLIYALAWNSGCIATFLSYRSIILLGEASYALYILHWPLHYWLCRIIGTSESQVQGSTPFFLTYLALLTGCSIFALYLIEKPARSAIRRLF